MPDEAADDVAGVYTQWADDWRAVDPTGPSLIDKRNVVWMYVDHEDPVCLQDAEDLLRIRPAFSELLDLLGTPVSHDFLGKVRRPIEVSSAKIEDKRTFNDGHFDDPKIVVIVDQLRNMAAADCLNAMLLEAKLYVSFAKVFDLALVSFDGTSPGGSAFFGLAFHRNYDTMYPEAQFLADYESVVYSVFECPAHRFVFETHDR